MLRTSTARRILPVALIAAAAMSLAGCGDEKKPSDDNTAAAEPTQDANGCTEYPSGDASDAVKVTGEFGKSQEATFTMPLKATSLERTLLDTGDGEVTKVGQSIDTVVTAFKGSDGSPLGTQPLPLKVGDPQTLAAFAAGVDCVPLKSRVVVVVPASDVYGPSGNAEVGVEGSDSIVIVTDVIGEKQPLKPAEWKTGVPQVTFAANGTPKVTIPAGPPPAALLLKVLKPGTGAVVEDGASVTLDYQGTNWATKKIFDQSYGKTPATFATNQVVQGFGAALVGQKVGTRLIVSIPPKYGYGEKGSGGGELEGQTLVFVIEIKSVA